LHLCQAETSQPTFSSQPYQNFFYFINFTLWIIKWIITWGRNEESNSSETGLPEVPYSTKQLRQCENA
jgi:hypothetical protein